MIRVKSDASDTVVTLRCSTSLKRKLQDAATANKSTLTEFVLSNAETAAERVLAAQEQMAA